MAKHDHEDGQPPYIDEGLIIRRRTHAHAHVYKPKRIHAVHNLVFASDAIPARLSNDMGHVSAYSGRPLEV